MQVAQRYRVLSSGASSAVERIGSQCTRWSRWRAHLGLVSTCGCSGRVRVSNGCSMPGTRGSSSRSLPSSDRTVGTPRLKRPSTSGANADPSTCLHSHRKTRSLLVVEVKSVVPDIQAMLHGLDRKGRLASAIAADRGWSVASVTKVLVLPEDRTARRRIETHAATIQAALPARTAAMRAWIRSPAAPCPGHGVVFLSDAPQASRSQRIRTTDPFR